MTSPDTGDMAYIITSGGRFFRGDLMIDHIFEITKSRTWPEILRALATKGERELRMKVLRPVVVDEEPWEEEEMMVEGQGPCFLWLNGRGDFRQAYTLSWSDSVALLADIASNPGAYGVLPQNVANLRLIHADITRLRRPDGPGYLVPPPPQNIDRKRHPKWPSALARFRLTKSTYDGVEYWALPDLLGLFMSSLGRAPTTATKRNFYLPLTAVYRTVVLKADQGRKTQFAKCVSVQLD
ncbi:uncharacterized protein NFIA_060420 [Aspergillus fischeri NRRL 181]|uniref:Uncharacterized protein n=1 Tax=Neosartorya fischeri (strain ATCC 1020 / DSM 3700 / CBS 544.65 / FGSC A1164 / JCM 1740 / NRRL 181 / WB 181) TaxID=331117 RepID=A1DPG5_NEOFI|nr:uncharacterized protein NFIA_060420 [Aspergillus fischeri NRRL 181]EAW16686.1 hypothetical protein NFIA_060420 [Aspergillus fischeri NRRL 181]